MRSCLIGLGRIAFTLERDPLRAKPCTHAGSLLELHRKSTRSRGQGFTLVGACDHHPEKLADFQSWWSRELRKRIGSTAARSFETPAGHTDYRALLRETRPDFVVIATRTDSHVDIACESIRHGARTVLLEKPIGTNLKDARRLERVARKHGAHIWINFERRYHPAYQLVERYVREERLGPLRSIQGQVLTWPLRKGANTASANLAGPLLHDAIHWLDLLLWYAGEPQRVTARMLESIAAPGVEDTAFVTLDYPEFQARLESGGRRNYFEFTIQLDFEQGRIRSGNEGHFFWQSKPSKRYKHFRDLQPFQPRIPGAGESAWLNLYRAVLKEVRLDAASDSPPNFQRLDDALAGMRIVETCARNL